MELLQLRYFVNVALGESMTKAAESLNVSQSTLSLSIKKLEEELGLNLFEKMGRKLRLTDNGTIFLEKTLKILIEIDNAKEDMLSRSKDSKNIIALATEVHGFTGGAKSLYSDLNPDIFFKETRESTKAIINMILTKQAGFGISYEHLEHPDIVSSLLSCSPLLLLVNKKHRLSKVKSVSLKDIQSDTLLTMKKGFGFRSLTDKLFALAGVQPKSVYEVVDEESLGFLVQNNVGVTFIPEYLVNTQHAYSFILPELAELKIEDPICKSEIYVSYSKNCTLSKTYSDFKLYLENFCELISEKNIIPAKSDFIP